MRRLVADQIKALAELNEVVSRHSRGIDNAATPRRLAVNEDALIAAATEAPRARAEFAPPAGRPRSEALPSREREVIREIGREIEREARDLPRRAAPAPRREERVPQEARHEAWGGETLVRPRHDEEQRAPRRSREEESAAEEPALRSIESLDALSADIARLVDHDAVVELWDRHNRGEKNAFTRRLYTTQGQKTFEDIRRKYRRSSEFRETVDRYIEEFERLLDQVGRDDRGQVLTRTYLASDTGKVYTLLAHASGRLG
jgi:hypothetical protein